MKSMNIPVATYRFQFNAGFRLAHARELVDYLAELGISDAYASPLFRSRENSAHGYDVIDHGVIDPAIGTEDDFRQWAEALADRGLGLMMDIVPNHMGIDDWHNTWWQDVLENGASSPYARFFDIDWDPPKESLKQKVLIPVLGEQYGRVLEKQELKLAYDGQLFLITYHDRRFPIEPGSSRLILERVLELAGPELEAENPQRMELESILTALVNLPPRTECNTDRIQQRLREKEVIRRRVATLYATSVPIHQAIDHAIVEFNGQPGEPHSFDRLEALLAEQAYRLAYWRVASDEINYRRFFDINALAAIRVEDAAVFQAVHAMIYRFLEKGWTTKLRIDHPDGLLDPQQYFIDLQRLYGEAMRSRITEAAGGAEGSGNPAATSDVATANGGSPKIYLAVEKILANDEGLPAEWPVAGTTGYDFLNLVNGVFVDRGGAYALGEIYVRFTGQPTSPADVLYGGKLAILSFSMSSELHVLAGHLERISEQHRWSRDFTRSALHRALREVIACFPVYRTYIGPTTEQVGAEDRRRILSAIRSAKRRNPAMSPAFFEFIASVLLMEHPASLNDEQRQQRRYFVLKFQQVTGPVMAKGMEDTAFYRWYPLASLNEVGGDLATPGTPLDEFHRQNAQRRAAWPHSMLATATHDTKRGEEFRTRLNVVSEMPEAWNNSIRLWQALNQRHRTEIDGATVPDANEEYLLYQTLVGTRPREALEDEAREAYVGRIVAYMDKALKEAKIHTSWINPHEEYDQATRGFIRRALDPTESGEFLADLDRFVARTADAGYLNGLAQSVLKITSPGVPDFYQGTELWDFNLVDPDNRRPVDFALRRRLLEGLRARAAENLPRLAHELLACWPDSQIKMFVLWRLLTFRRQHATLFAEGNYLPVSVEGPRAENVCGFIREHDGKWLVVAVPRLIARAWPERPPSTRPPSTRMIRPPDGRRFPPGGKERRCVCRSRPLCGGRMS